MADLLAGSKVRRKNPEVAKAFGKVYSQRLEWPETIIVDPGRELMGDMTQFMKKHNVIVQRSEAGNHRAQAFVERTNRTLSKRLFSHQYAQEMVTGGRSTEWVKRLPAVLKAME